MKRLTWIFISSLMLGTAGMSNAGSSWQDDLTALLMTDDEVIQTKLIEKIFKAEADWHTGNSRKTVFPAGRNRTDPETEPLL